MKSSIILVIGIPEEEEKEERENEIFEKMMPKNFEKLKKDTKPQIQEAQRITNKLTHTETQTHTPHPHTHRHNIVTAEKQNKF